MKRTGVWSAIGAAGLIISIAAGCADNSSAREVSTRPATQPAPATSSTPAARPAAVSSGAQSAGAATVERILPTEIIVGRPFEYQLRVTNTTGDTLENVVVTDVLGQGVAFVDANPRVTASPAGEITWPVGRLAPRQSQSLRVTAKAARPGDADACATVTYSMRRCDRLAVLQPAFELVRQAPAEVLSCEELPIGYTVRNTGTAVLRGVRINEPLPAGFTTADGRNAIAAEVGDLNPGASKQVTVQVRPAGPGRLTGSATAATADGLTQKAEGVTVVRQPALEVIATAPKTTYLGRSVIWVLEVVNRGDGVSRDTVLEQTLPAGTSVASVSDGGKAEAGRVTWNLGALEPKASRKVSLTLSSAGAADLRGTATVRGKCAAPASVAAATNVVGISAVLLEVIDLSDPIQVGNNEVYEIKVTNQGSAADTNIRIVAELEDTMQYVSADGATRAAAGGKRVEFAPLPSLAPKASATWRVTVKAVNAGDVRFKVSMTTDQLTRPVEETEATNFYK